MAGLQFVAVATSQRMLRVMSLAGLHLAIIALQGPPIALAAHGNELAVVWHAGNAVDGEQMLAYMVSSYAYMPLLLSCDKYTATFRF